MKRVQRVKQEDQAEDYANDLVYGSANKQANGIVDYVQNQSDH